MWSGGRALESTVTKVPANAFTINSNSTNGNTSFKADFSYKKLILIKYFLEFLKFFINFLVFSNNIFLM